MASSLNKEQKKHLMMNIVACAAEQFVQHSQTIRVLQKAKTIQ
jgi:hypothetical protein